MANGLPIAVIQSSSVGIHGPGLDSVSSSSLDRRRSSAVSGDQGAELVRSEVKRDDGERIGIQGARPAPPAGSRVRIDAEQRRAEHLQRPGDEPAEQPHRDAAGDTAAVQVPEVVVLQGRSEKRDVAVLLTESWLGRNLWKRLRSMSTATGWRRRFYWNPAASPRPACRLDAAVPLNLIAFAAGTGLLQTAIRPARRALVLRPAAARVRRCARRALGITGRGAACCRCCSSRAVFSGPACSRTCGWPTRCRRTGRGAT